MLSPSTDVDGGRHRGAAHGKAGAALLPGLVAIAALAALALGVAELVDGLSPLVVGIAVGAVVANVVGVPASWAPGVAVATRQILRFGVVLLGLRLSLGELAELGVRGLVVVAVVVAVTFFGTRWLAARLGVPAKLGLLVATGYSICGASAIAAVDGVVKADEEETAYAISLVTLCGTLSIVVLPLLAGPLGLDGAAFGSWVGGAVHDVGQVVATANHEGAAALAAATVVKLTRVVLLAPLVAGVAIRHRRSGATPGTKRPPVVPLFVVGFLAMIVVRSLDVLGDGALDAVATLEKIVFTVALVGLGLGVDLGRMRTLGGRPLALGMASWVLVATAAYVGTALTH